jgi:hypothetical protein
VGARDGEGPISDGQVCLGARGRDGGFEVGGITGELREVNLIVQIQYLRG